MAARDRGDRGRAGFDGLALPRVIGHRGAAASAPENTLAGLRRAAELGATWVEFDVQRSADGRLLLFHDDTLERTTDGQGLVSRASWAELRRLDAGAWFAPEFAGERVPSFEEALELLGELELGANIEIKASSVPGRSAELGAAVAHATAELWPEHLPPPILSSFAAEALAGCQERQPELPRGLLLEELDAFYQRRFDGLGCTTLHLRHDRLSSAVVGAIHRALRGAPVLAYTINNPARAEQLFSWGVASVFSDCPERLVGGDPRLP